MSMREWMENGNEIGIEVLVFILGGVSYGMLEILFRGYTHWTMVLTGGACMLTLYTLEGWLLSMPLLLGAAAGALIITSYEFAVGYIVNVRLGWQVWDYSGLAGNIMGQVCPIFTFAWFCISLLFLGLVRMLS
ncbi:MAG: hypothetical protein HFE73_08985 [Firmicutes bacterium]|nr:hypothetical protein [Bacillota bacterium]